MVIHICVCDRNFGVYSNIVNQRLKSLTTNSNPYISTPSYIGYNLCLFYLQHLIQDLKCRAEASANALPFLDNRLQSFVSTLMECKVPPELAIELKNLAPVFDPLHTTLEYIPSFACFHIMHDFGRTIPAHMYFQIHNLLSDISNSSTPIEIMNDIYELEILTYHGNHRTVSNLFGGPFTLGPQSTSHQNWFRQSFERTMIPTFGLCLTDLPTVLHS